jgi:putative selenate reductase
MAVLHPQPLEVLLGRALAEFEAERAIFGLPRRSFWRGVEGRDLSVAHPGGRVATPLGPAAGPHTQLAHNIVVAWLAGARVVELKTVQVLDRLTIPRPCIDAGDVGYNVEWSQELTCEDSAAQYATAWVLIHALHARGVTGAAGPPATRFDASVGYDLAGIRSDKVARFLDTMRDAGELLRGLRDRLPPALRAAADVEVPPRIVEVATLSTFHGCPAEEIEAIVEHLLGRHAMHVVVKLNPTLLGYEAADLLLRGRLGFDEVELDRKSFEQDLRWDQAVALFERLSPIAARSGLTLGAKFSNTLVVRNTRRALAGEVVYLSGPPLHAIAIQLADRFARVTGGHVPISFSGGVDAENFADTVACGLAPVTTCTDLLKPTGYRRLPRYLKFLVAEMERLEARDVAEFVVAKAGRRDGRGAASDQTLVHAAGLQNLADYAGRVAGDPRYHAEAHRVVPARHGPLALFDCASCNNCTLVCPNGAFFSVPIPPVQLATWDLVIERGSVRRLATDFATTREEQWVVYADFCNDCGNCDPFCPEEGGPFRVKPRLFGSRASFDAAAPADGMLCEDGGDRWLARFAGVAYVVEFAAAGDRIADGAVEATLDAGHRLVATRVLAAREGHVLPLWRYHALRLLREAVRKGINPVTAARPPTSSPRS